MTIDTTYLDSDTDKAKPARASLLAMAVLLNAMTGANGANEIGYISDVAGAVQISLQAKGRQIFMPEEVGAVGDGGADDTVALQRFAAAPAKGRVKVLNAKTYKASALADPLDFQPDDCVLGSGPATLIDASGSTLGAGEPVIRIAGSLTSLGNLLTATANAGAVSATFSSVAGLAVGDVLCFYNATNYSWSNHRAEYRAGEYVRIGRVSGSTVYFTAPLYDSYATTVGVYKLGGTGARLANFRVKTLANQSLGWQIDCGVDVSVEHVQTSGSTYTGGEFKRCAGITYIGAAFQASVSTDDEYGIAVSNSQWGTFNLTATGGRHPISFGGGDYPCCVPCRTFSVFGSQFGNLGPTGAGDLHGNTEDIKFFGISFANGTDVGGANHKFVGCVMRGNTNSGIAVYFGEPVKGTFELANCTLETYVDPNASGYGLVNIGNATNAKAPWRVVLSNCTFSAPAGTLFPVLVDIAGGAYAPDIIVNGGMNLCAGATQFVRLQRSGGAATIGLVKVADVAGLPAGCYYAINTGTGLTVNRYELPEQAGTVSVPIGTAAAVYTAAVTFRHPYPGTPIVVPGLAANAYGGDMVNPAAAGATSTGFTASVATADAGNFASSDTATLRWNARMPD